MAEQEAECREAAEEHGWQVVEVFREKPMSASRFARGEREVYGKVIDHVKAGRTDILMCWEVSRASRDLAVGIQLRDDLWRLGVKLYYDGSLYDLSKAGDRKRVADDLAAAEYESGRSSERIRRTVRAQAAKGGPHGPCPFGYERHYDPATRAFVEQVPHPEQARLLQTAVADVLAGKTVWAVAQSWNAAGVPQVRGKAWDTTAVQRLLLSPVYIGKRSHHGNLVDAVWPPLITDAEHAALVTKLTDPARRTNRGTALRHLLTGIGRCGIEGCDGRLRVQINNKSRGYNYPSYGCNLRSHLMRSQAFVDGVVLDLLLGTDGLEGRLQRHDVIDLLNEADDDSAGQQARDEVAELRQRLDGFYVQAAEGRLSDSGLERIERELLPKIEAAEGRARPSGTLPTIVRDLAESPEVRRTWLRLDLSQQRAVVSAFMTVTILPSAGRRNDPATVHIDWVR